MLTTVRARTPQGTYLDLPLDDYYSTGFVVQGIDGLDPVKATVNSSSYATQDGEQYQSARRDKRNIVLKLGLEPDYSSMEVSELREKLYDFFMPKSPVDLIFQFDNGKPDVEISGRVESLDSPLFVQDPTATISILNFLPDFIDPVSVSFAGNSVSNLTDTVITYDGTSETGFRLRLFPNRTITEFTIYMRGLDGITRSMFFAATLLAGDVLDIRTSQGNKGVYLTRAGLTVSLLYSLSTSSQWLTLRPGDNALRVAVSGASMPYTVNYTRKYGGL